MHEQPINFARGHGVHGVTTMIARVRQHGQSSIIPCPVLGLPGVSWGNQAYTRNRTMNLPQDDVSPLDTYIANYGVTEFFLRPAGQAALALKLIASSG